MTLKYDDGLIKIYLGDNLDILPTIESESIDFICTDPPFGVEFQSNRRIERLDKLENDDNLTWVEPVFRELWRVLKNDSLCLSFVGWPSIEDFMIPWKRIGFVPKSKFVFEKNNWALGWFSRSAHEEAVLLAKGKPPKPVYAPSSMQRMIRPINTEHPTNKGYESVMPLISAYTKPRDIVLDPWLGSGSFLRAAKNLGRRGIGIEIKESFVEEAISLIRQEVLFQEETNKTPISQGILL